MRKSAEITSTEAIAEFRAALLVYIAKVRPLLDDSVDEVFRTREWLRVEQRVYWENKVREFSRKLNDAQQALFSAQLARLREPSSAELMAVQKAKHALNNAEEKLRTVKALSVGFEKEAQPRIKQIEQVRALLGTDLPAGALFLERVLQTLESYHAVRLEAPASEGTQR